MFGQHDGISSTTCKSIRYLEVLAVMAIVVVGAGVAAVRFVQQLRRRGSTDAVIVIGSERHWPYDRPPLSKQVLHGALESKLPELLTREEWSGLDADLRLGVVAEGLDVEAQTILTSDGAVPYDSLVIANGATPTRIPKLRGQVLRTWDDAVELRGQIRPGSAVAIIGAGLIGCEVAASARALYADVHVIDVLPTPMSRVVGSGLADAVIDLHTRKGVTFHLGTQVVSDSDGRLSLEDGTVLAADVVVQAIGARPDVAWLAGTALDSKDGVPCDGSGHTVAPDVYAIGDVAAWEGGRSEHWTSATEQATVVAALHTQQDIPAKGASYWWSDQYDVKFQGLGSVTSADETRLRYWSANRRPIALYGRAGRLTAVVGMSAAGGVMRLRSDIEAGTALDEVSARFD